MSKLLITVFYLTFHINVMNAVLSSYLYSYLRLHDMVSPKLHPAQYIVSDETVMH